MSTSWTAGGGLSVTHRVTQPTDPEASVRPLPTRVWTLFAALPLVTVLAFLAGVPGLLRVAYPGVALLCAAALFHWYPPGYIGYVWWLWFLSPLARRLVDLRAGWDETSTILITPLLVTGLCVATFLRHLPKLRRLTWLPFALITAGLGYAYFLGVLRQGVTSASYTLLLYVVPMSFGFHIAVHWRRFPEYRAVTLGAVVAGAGLMGVYGVWQFFDPQLWDAYWMEKSRMATIGVPQPFMVRVFGTMNSPLPFAMALMTGLLLLFSRRSATQWIVGIPGYLALLLSLVRTAWLGWLVAFLVYLFYATPRSRMRIVATVLPTGILAALLALTPALQAVINRRFSSFTELEEDISLSQRLAMYTDFFRGSLVEGTGAAVRFDPIGNGLGGTGAGAKLGTSWRWADFDSGLIDVIQAFGLPGALLIYGAIGMLLYTILRAALGRDRFLAASRGIAIATFAAMFAQNTLTGVMGTFFWGFAGFCLAASQLSRRAAR